jgi:hypothetical protein
MLSPVADRDWRIKWLFERDGQVKGRPYVTQDGKQESSS